MPFRKANTGDLDTVLGIYARAREFMKSNGNPSQWQDSYPPLELVKEDIELGQLIIYEENGESEAVFAFLQGGDKIYDSIEGEWLNDKPHAAVHRVASAGRSKGVLGKCMQYCLTFTDNIKIDTHPDNIIMQRALEKLGFVKCGNVGELIAYQLAYN